MAFWSRSKPPPLPALRSSSPNNIPARRNAFKRELVELRDEFPTAITAGGERIRHGQAAYLRRLIQPWQIRSFGYYDLLGEIKYAAQFYSRALSNLRLYAAERDDAGEIVETTNQDVIDALERIKDPGGSGRSGLLAAYGRLMFIAGEAYLFVSRNQFTGLEQWEMLSTDELRVLDGSITRFKAPSLPAMQFRPAPDDSFEEVEDDDAAIYRLWRRHPRFSELPDAHMEAVLDICEELVLLTQAVRARARSRLAGPGVLFMDERMTTRPMEPSPDEDPLEDPFLADFTEAVTTAITDEGTASAAIPLITRVTVPDGVKLEELFYHLQVTDPTQLYPETGLRMECIKRLAIGLDMPPEILLGLASVNHWTGWLVNDDVWRAHLQPVANQLVEDLTSAYLGPYLKDQNVPDWDKYVIAYDASAVIVHPDRTKDALDLYDRVIIGKAAVREVADFGDDDAPTEDERAEMVGIKTRDSSLAWDGIPAPRGGALETSPGVVESAQAPPEGTTEPGTGGDVEPGPPAGGAPEAPPGTAAVDEGREAMILGAAQLGVLRAREAAGSRLRTASRRDKEAVELIAGATSSEVAGRLGRARVRSLTGQTETDIVGGARGLILDALRVFGVDDVAVAETIAETVEKHAARTLYQERPSPLPASFLPFVRGLLASSNGTNGHRIVE